MGQCRPDALTEEGLLCTLRRVERATTVDGDSKDDLDSKRPDDLPRSDVPRECPESCFLYEWWCLFWDMFNAQRGKGEGRNVLNYVNHTNVSSPVIYIIQS